LFLISCNVCWNYCSWLAFIPLPTDADLELGEFLRRTGAGVNAEATGKSSFVRGLLNLRYMTLLDLVSAVFTRIVGA